MRGPLDVHRVLLERLVGHEVVHLPRALGGADDLPDVLGLPASRCIAVRLLTGDEPLRPGGPRLVAAAVPACSWPSPSRVARQVGVHGLRQATSAEASAATDFAASLVPPIGLPAEVPLLVHAGLLAEPVVYAAVGAGRVALGIRIDDLVAVTGALVLDLAPSALPAADLVPA